MEQCFVDSSAFYALKDPSDKNNKEAIDFMEKIRRNINMRLVTSNFICDETITLIRMKLGHESAVRFGDQIRESKVVKILHVTEQLEEQGWQIFKKYNDKDFSFTDCTSFAIMDSEEIQQAFTFDKHFLQYGFNIRP